MTKTATKIENKKDTDTHTETEKFPHFNCMSFSQSH